MKSVRLRLLVLALLPLIVVLPILLIVTMLRWTDQFDDLLIDKVASDLRIAEQYMQRIVTFQGQQIAAVAGSVEFQGILNDPPALMRFLDGNRERLGLDYLVLRDANQSNLIGPEAKIVRLALASGSATSINIFTSSELNKISPALAVRAALPLITTEAAIPTDRTAEDRGMVILGATKIETNGNGAVLIGGTLLNQNLDFIDTINDLVYPNENGDTDNTGTATLFLEDVRISTNVRLFENVRALGTRVSEIVYRTVLDDGHTWLDRAFVVNDWYISGYLPILDSQAQRIGMLYVGFRERPFIAVKAQTYIAMLIAFITVIAISIPFFLWLARGIFSPLEDMNNTMKRVGEGSLDARINLVSSRDEIGAVANHLNTLLDQLQDRDQELRDWTETLNERVEQRTTELRVANIKLKETYKQLVLSEKLASIGEITAGVAHEINNPVAVIQGNVDVMRMALGAQSAKYATELDLVDEQVRRIISIVGKLLQFAKPNDFSNVSEILDVEVVLEDSVILVQPSMLKINITIEREFLVVPNVKMDRGELQQVLVNLLLNAVQAIPQGGTLWLGIWPETRDQRKGVVIAVRDSGRGIEESVLEHIFDPFFTTKLGQGTGLGLSISQTLMHQAGGLITAKSQIEHGSEFLVWIPKVA